MIGEDSLLQGDDRDYIIGFEGSALTSDQYIAITTEWFDHDGTLCMANSQFRLQRLIY